MKQVAFILIISVFIVTTITLHTKEKRDEIFVFIFVLSGIIALGVTIMVLARPFLRLLKFKKHEREAEIQVISNNNYVMSVPPMLPNTPNVYPESLPPEYRSPVGNEASLVQLISERKPLEPPPKYESIIDIPPPSYHQ